MLVTDLAWSPDGSTIAREYLRYGSTEGFLGVSVDSSTSKLVVRRLWMGEAGAAMPAFRSDGSFVLASPADATDDGGPIAGDAVVLYNRVTGKVEGSLSVANVTNTDASADGRWVAASVAGDGVRLVADINGLGDLDALPTPVGTVAVAVN